MRFERVQHLAHTKKYTILFVTCFLVAFVVPAIPEGTFTELIVTVTLTFALLAGTYVVARIRHLRVVMFTLVGIALVLNWTGLTVDKAFTFAASVRLLYFGMLTWLVFVDVLYGPKHVVSERLFGAAAVYLLMTFVWSDAYLLLQHYQPDAFTATLGQHGAAYFSLVTQTTLGYGDISPLTRQARSLATMQSTVGALYIAITVARLAGMGDDSVDAESSSDQ